MKPSTRIILNTLATYSYSLFALFVSLFSARWVLQALGQSDFGLYGVVGSIILLMTFLNGGMSVGVSRFYAYSIGRGHNLTEEEATDDLKRWFNTALSIHMFLPFLLILIGWPVGEYAIQHWLTIPPDRIAACIWVFRISLATAFMSMFSVPFTAMYAAHQLISELAVFGVLNSCCNFVGAYCLLRVQSDRLIVYALYMMAISAGIPILQIIRAMFKFKACRIRLSYMYNRKYLKELFGFVGWKMFSVSCIVARTQGAPILINIYFGPQVNAAYSVAQRVSIQASTLCAAMMGAFQPAIISLEGKGDREKMLGAALQACKFGTLLVLFFAIPLMLEMDAILGFWLKTPPEYTSQLCMWMLLILIIDHMTAGHMLAIAARGKIAAYELIQGTILVLALPLMWILFRLKFSPVSLGYALFITMVVYCLGRLIFCRILLNLPIVTWSRQVAIPLGIVCATGMCVGYAIISCMPSSFFRVVFVFITNAIVCCLFGWFVVLNKTEKGCVIDIRDRLIYKWCVTVNWKK